MADGLPLNIDVRGRHCVCVGGGAVTARRVPALLHAGATVTVIAPELHPDLGALASAGQCEYQGRAYQAGDTAGAYLVLAATGVPEVDAAVAREGLSGGALVCVASRPELGNCQFMATLRRGSLLVAIHTGGAAPAVAAALRRQMEETLPERIGDTLDTLADLRLRLRQTVADPAERARRWCVVLESGALDAVLREGTPDRMATMERLLLGE